MLVLDDQNVRDYLRSKHMLRKNEHVAIHAWETNDVRYLEVSSGHRWYDKKVKFVIKQMRLRANCEQNAELFFQEAGILHWCSEHINSIQAPNGEHLRAPSIAFQDRENILFALHDLPVDIALSSGWEPYQRGVKANEWDWHLDMRDNWVIACANFLSQMHALSWGDSMLGQQFGNRSRFDNSWVMPDSTKAGAFNGQWLPLFEAISASICQHTECLIHGDLSPKKLLGGWKCSLLIGWELSHFGDPACDIGRFLAHLLAIVAIIQESRREDGLALIRRFWKTYVEALYKSPEITTAIERRALSIAQLGLFVLGNSRTGIVRLNDDQWTRLATLAEAIREKQPTSIEELTQLLTQVLPMGFRNKGRFGFPWEERYHLP